MDIEWELLLKKVQNSIESYAKPNYKNAYKLEELYYWYYIAKWMAQDAKNNTVTTVLDVGCGHGTLSVFAKEIYNCEVVSVDVTNYLSPKMVRDFELNYILCDIETEIQEIYEKEAYDRILLTEVLEHLYYNPVPTLFNLKSMLKKNGKLFLSTPDMVEWGFIGKYYNHVGEMPNPKEVKKPEFSSIDEHIYHYTYGECNRIIAESGFKINGFEYCKLGSRARHLNYELMKR
ncbi:MAG: class I SAM-dependent methyltransferase [Candidatus Thermoplasmatota archaeon]|nr:class I SAM-dependent methyltransferase [Candidatus Thermoplasmatota archaeon]MDH7506253.1 class I SAM-dependent methyltransferase [Candidatus Thermoplasmatota archaeon]